MPSSRISTEIKNQDDFKKINQRKNNNTYSFCKRNKNCLIILGLISGLCSLGTVGTALGVVYGVKSKEKIKIIVSNSKITFK